MKIILDRFEDGYAICEDMNTRDALTYPAEELPKGISPGHVLIHDGNNFIIDYKETKARRKRIKKIYNSLRG